MKKILNRWIREELGIDNKSAISIRNEIERNSYSNLENYLKNSETKDKFLKLVREYK